MQMVILAGGEASRMRPLSRLLAPPLIRIDDRPFLAYQLDLIRANGIKRVVLCIGYLGHKIKAYFHDGSAFGVEIVYSEDGPNLLGTAGALRNAMPYLDDVFFVTYGDAYVVLQYPKLWSYFQKFERHGLLVLNHGHDEMDGSATLSIPETGDFALSRPPRLVAGPSTRRNGRPIAPHVVHPPAEECDTPDSRPAILQAAFGHQAPPPCTCTARDGLVAAYRPGDPEMDFTDTGVSILRREALALVPPHAHQDLPVLFDQLARQHQLLALRTEMRLHSIATYAGLHAFRQYIARMSA